MHPQSSLFNLKMRSLVITEYYYSTSAFQFSFKKERIANQQLWPIRNQSSIIDAAQVAVFVDRNLVSGHTCSGICQLIHVAWIMDDVNSKLAFAAYHHEDCECCANSYTMRTVHFVTAALSIFGPNQNAI